MELLDDMCHLESHFSPFIESRFGLFGDNVSYGVR